MKKTHATVISSLMLSGAVLVMAPQAWTQTGGSSGTGSSRGSESQKSSDPSGTASQRGSSSSSSTDMQSERGQSGAQGQRSAGRISKDKVKEVQAALKSKGMDPGPEDGIMGPKTQAALREFQKSNSLTVTGRLDSKTASALGVDVASSTGASGSSSSSGMSGSSSKDSSGMGSSSGSGQSSSSGSSTSPQTSEGVSKRGTQAGSPPAGESKGGTSAAPATKPAGRE